MTSRSLSSFIYGVISDDSSPKIRCSIHGAIYVAKSDLRKRALTPLLTT